MNKMRKQFLPYSVHAGLRHFGPGFGSDVFRMCDVEGFSGSLCSGFISVIGCLNKLSRCFSKVISLRCSNYSLVQWLGSGIVLWGGGQLLCVLVMSQSEENVQEHYLIQAKS
jgi:hypothetical protein